MAYNMDMKNKKAQTTYQRQVASDRKAAARERAAEREAAAAAALDDLLDSL
jgi:membrane protein involved in colicin uptake